MPSTRSAGTVNAPALTLARRLAQDELSAHELRLLVRQLEIQELLGGDQADCSRWLGHAIDPEGELRLEDR